MARSGLTSLSAHLRSLWEQLPRLVSMRWAALPITDRRWTAPFAAIALGFGLFIGVAIGPGVSGTFGGSGPLVIELPGPVASSESSEDDSMDTPAPTLGSPGGSTSPGPAASLPPALVPVAPAPIPVPAPVPLTEPPATTPTTPAPTPQEPSPDPAPGLSFDGTVLQVNRAAGSYTLAIQGGQMVAVHASSLPKPGDTVDVPVRELYNLTYAEGDKREVTGSRKKVKFGGIVTFRDPASGVYAVSRKGASVLVHASDDAPSELPQVGDLVDVTAEIEAIQNGTSSSASVESPADAPPADPTPPVSEPLPSPLPEADPLPPGCGTRPKPPPEPETRLVEVEIEVDTESLSYADIEAVVQGVCSDTNQLIVSADALNESGSDITIEVPEDGDFDLDAIKPGDVLALTATIERDGSLLLEGLSSDRRIKGADDAELAQGDQA